MNTYSRLQVNLVRGKGVKVWDDTGKEYIDMLSGIAVCNLGHAHPAVVKALQDQAERLFHCSNLYHIPQQETFADMIVQNSFDSRVFFCNSGAEANEGAIKLARRYCSLEGRRGSRIVTFSGSFHGRTLATVAATGQDRFKQGYDPIPAGFVSIPFGDIDALEEVIDDEVGAVMIEPIQGEGGIIVPPQGFFKKLRNLCDRHGLLLILDEVQTGMARTGSLFGYMYEDIEPDVMTLAKALGNGFPVGALVAKPKVAEAFSPGTHASTFGGNPLAMSACIATLDTMLKDDIAKHSLQQGSYLKTCLEEIKEIHPGIKEIRGRGLMMGVEFDRNISSLCAEGINKGILLNVQKERILRLVPPLVISKAEIDAAVGIIDALLREKGL